MMNVDEKKKKKMRAWIWKNVIKNAQVCIIVPRATLGIFSCYFESIFISTLCRSVAKFKRNSFAQEIAHCQPNDKTTSCYR